MRYLGGSVLPTIALLATIAALAPVGHAAGLPEPEVAASWVTEVTATSARLRAEIDANGLPTTFRFEYLSEAAYRGNLEAEPPRDPFEGAARAPATGAGNAGDETEPIRVFPQQLSGLAPLTQYRYRVVASNSAGTAFGPARPLRTEAATNAFSLLDSRGWELVSPADKSGGAVSLSEAVFGGGAFQAGARGGTVTYSSASSFAGGDGAPGTSQYLSTRGAGGWSTANVTAPALSGSYGDQPDGVPYRLFSADLSRGLLLNGDRCRGEGSGCPVANPPLPGSGAPAGYQNYYLRDAGGGFAALLDAPDFATSPLEPDEFGVSAVGATEDLADVVLSSCAALSAGAVQVAAVGGCDESAPNLYEWSAPGGLALLNLLPGAVESAPGATLAAPFGAISPDGSRVYWAQGGDLYLRDGATTRWVDEGVGGGAAFQAAGANGAVAYFTKAGHLYRYVVETETATDLTPTGGVQGVLGVSGDGSRAFYLTASGLFEWDEGAIAEIAPGADAAAPGSYPPATATARVSADGAHLAFLSDAELTDFDNHDDVGGQPDTELYLYGPPPGGGAATLACISCNPTGERPLGSTTIPGTVANGSTSVYRPRAMIGDGRRIFFTSSDGLVIQDTNKRPDVYEWEAQGVGSCGLSGGCVGLISSGRSAEASTFLDASADGSDVFFLTGQSLVSADPGSIDVYDARAGGGFAEPGKPIPCNGDACQALPAAPEDPTPGTLVPSAGNPPLRIAKAKPGKRHKRHRKRGQRRGRG